MNGEETNRWREPEFARVHVRGAPHTRKTSSRVFQRWSSVVRWTVLGPLVCLVVAWIVTGVLFTGSDLAVETEVRLALAATSIPLIIATPLFFAFTIRMRRLAVANVRLARAANVDSLTGCLNRGAFTQMAEEYLRNTPGKPSGALLVIDADHFKSINDGYGHDQGDVALGLIASTMRTISPAKAIVGRLGGEEFGVFLPDASRIHAYLVAERIRRGIRHIRFAPDDNRHQLSVSIGGASFSDHTSFSELFRIADQGLYAAKKSGRNAVNITTIEPQETQRCRA